MEATYVAPGNWKAMVQTRLRNLKDQTIQDYRLRSEDRVEQAYLEETEMEFLYLTELWKGGRTIVMVTHNDHISARSQRIVRLFDGLVLP